MKLILTSVMMIFIVLSNGDGDGILKIYAGENCNTGPGSNNLNQCSSSGYSDCKGVAYCACIGPNKIKKIIVDFYAPDDPNCEGEIQGHGAVTANDECELTEGECGDYSWTVYVKMLEEDWDSGCGSCP
eukprot:UN01411